MSDKKVDNTYYPYKEKREYSILLVIKDKELYLSSSDKLKHLGVICRYILNDSYRLGIVLRTHFSHKNRILGLYLSEGYYSPVAALAVLKSLERNLPESVLLKNKEQIINYTKHFRKQVLINFVDMLKGLWFKPAKKEKKVGFISDDVKINKTTVTFIDDEKICEKYEFRSVSSNHTYCLILRKLISIYSNTEYESIFDFNDVSIDAKYKNLLIKLWEERNAKVEKID